MGASDPFVPLQVGQKASEGLGYCSDWTEQIRKNLKAPVDIKLMLRNAQEAFLFKSQWPLIDVRPRRRNRSRFTLSRLSAMPIILSD